MSDLIPHPPTLHPPRFLIPLPEPASVLPRTTDELPLSWTNLLLALQLARNYQMILPEHPEWLDEAASWSGEAALFAVTIQFLERVNEHCFPVQTELMSEEVDECAWLLNWAPLQPGGLYLWDDWLDYSEPIPFLCYLQHQVWARAYAPQELDDEAYPELTLAPELDILELDDVLNQMVAQGQLTLPPPLDALPWLIGMVTRTTENFWLDCSEEALSDGERVGWDDLDVVRLMGEWHDARPVLEQVNTLLRWVEQETRPRLKMIADLLNQAHDTRKLEERARGTPAFNL